MTASAIREGWDTMIGRAAASIGLPLACAILAPPGAASAAEITHWKLDDTTEVISIEGDIVPGDVERFRQVSIRYPKARVKLNSDGGALLPAIEIGRILRVAGYSTSVPHDGVCTSACALIWLAGEGRSLFGQVGFHAAYRNNNGTPQESGAANALVGNYLTLLGLPTRAIIFATAAPPDRILWLTSANKEEAGIDFIGIAGADAPRIITRPIPRPVAAPQASPELKFGTPIPPPPFPEYDQSNWLHLEENWDYLAEDADGTIYYVNGWTVGDASTGSVDKWVKLDHSRNRTGAVEISYWHIRIICRSRAILISDIREYGVYGRDASYSGEDEGTEFSDIRPGSIEESLWDDGCQK